MYNQRLNDQLTRTFLEYLVQTGQREVAAAASDGSQ